MIQLAKLLGWRVYHTHDSRHSVAGFPDLVLVNARQARVVFAELKAEDGLLSREQREWLQALDHARQECHVWRPSDWLNDTIDMRLRPPAATF